MKLAHRLGFGIASLLAASASASIIPTFTGLSTTAGVTTYSYDVQLDSMQNLITGSQLCIADITGLTGTPTEVAGWTAANNLTGACPINAGVTVPNSASSVLYTYTAAATIAGPLDLGIFTFQSTVSTAGTANLAYGAVDQKKSNLSVAANQGEVNGPLAPVITPEPATLGLFGVTFVGLGLMKRRAVRK